MKGFFAQNPSHFPGIDGFSVGYGVHREIPILTVHLSFGDGNCGGFSLEPVDAEKLIEVMRESVRLLEQMRIARPTLFRAANN